MLTKQFWPVLNLHPNWVCFATSCYDGHINRSLAAASGSDEVETRRSRVILSPVAPTQETHDRFYPPQSSTAAQHHNVTFSSNKKPITIFNLRSTYYFIFNDTVAFSCILVACLYPTPSCCLLKGFVLTTAAQVLFIMGERWRSVH